MKFGASATPHMRCAMATVSLAAWSALAGFVAFADAKELAYPPARTEAVADTYGTTVVADPYRWLENLDSPETTTWLAAENAVTRKILDASPKREAWRARLTALYSIPRASVPLKRGSRYFYSRATGSENQQIWYVQEGPHGTPRVLLDPNTMAKDGTVAITGVKPSDDGSLFAYKIGENGSDREIIHVRDVASGHDRTDEIQWVKFSPLVWRPDNDGFYYKRYPQPGTVPVGEENYSGKIYYHHLSTPQALDALVFECPGDKVNDPAVQITHNGRYLVLSISRGASNENEVYFLDRTQMNASPVPVFTGFTAQYAFLEAIAGKFYFWSTENAPKGKIIVIDYAQGKRSRPRDVVPETADVIADARVVNSQLVIERMHNATSSLTVYRLDTTKVGDIPLPGLGSLAGLGGEPLDSELFFTYTSFTQPATIYSYSLLTQKLTEFFPGQILAYSPADFVADQVWYPSKDGTQVSMFIVRKKGTPLDGQRPTWLSAYGGFDVSITPAYSPTIIAWCENGGVFATPNLRGGGEYGEAWHKAGMLEKKQNVFDDFIAAGQYLIAQKYTSSTRLAIEGGSNGGLLTGACLVQRPDLFGAALVRVPVADMLRYHRFTVGRFWIPEYGSADDPTQFPFLYKYSPLHNVKDGTKYPATMVTTADHDDRVFPGMAFKFAARLQAATDGDAPILLRVDLKAGHGHDKPTAKRVDEDVDVFSFLYMGLGAH